MKNNLELIEEIVDYIDIHLEENLTVDFLSNQFGYSKYHLQRMFSSIVTFPIHTYIQRRRLTEAARMLIFTDKSIMEVTLLSGYNTQQSFHHAFKKLFKCSPYSFRKKRKFFPIQLKYKVDNNKKLRGDEIMEIRFVNNYELKLIGYRKSTRFGFHVIDRCMRKIEKESKKILDQTNPGTLIGLNDYSKMSSSSKHPIFDFFGCAEVNSITSIPKGMEAMICPISNYIVFTFKGNKEDSLEPVANYIYQEWFPHSTYIFNEQAMFDFSKCDNTIDSDGNNTIEYWIPIL